MSRTVDSLKQSGSLIEQNFCGCLMYETGRQSGLGVGGLVVVVGVKMWS